jgi:hypothetical protein
VVNGEAPRYSYFIVVCTGFLALALFFLTLFKFEIRGSYPAILASGVCFVLGAVAAYIWPNGSWRWGLWVSCGFWLFFGFVFISFLLKNELEWHPAMEAVSVVGLACAGGWLGRRLSDRTRGSAAKQ